MTSNRNDTVAAFAQVALLTTLLYSFIHSAFADVETEAREHVVRAETTH